MAAPAQQDMAAVSVALNDEGLCIGEGGTPVLQGMQTQCFTTKQLSSNMLVLGTSEETPTAIIDVPVGQV